MMPSDCGDVMLGFEPVEIASNTPSEEAKGFGSTEVLKIILRVAHPTSSVHIRFSLDHSRRLAHIRSEQA